MIDPKIYFPAFDAADIIPTDLGLLTKYLLSPDKIAAQAADVIADNMSKFHLYNNQM